jgi:hypothetical protein
MYKTIIALAAFMLATALSSAAANTPAMSRSSFAAASGFAKSFPRSEPVLIKRRPSAPSCQSDSAFLNQWAAETREDLPETHSIYEMTDARSYCPSGCEVDFPDTYLAITASMPGHTKADVPFNQVVEDMRTLFAGDYCETEGRERNLIVRFHVSDRNGVLVANTLVEPNDCPANRGTASSQHSPAHGAAPNNARSSEKVPVSAKLSLQSGIQPGANGRNRLPINKSDPAATVDKLNPAVAIYLEVKFSDGTSSDASDYNEHSARNIIFDDTSGDPDDLIEVIYWDVENNPKLGKYAGQLTSTGKGTGTATLKVSFRNAPNVRASVPVEVVSGSAANRATAPGSSNAGTSSSRSDSDYLNGWAAEVRVDLPETLGEFQLIDAQSQCPKGCQEQLDPGMGHELALTVSTDRYSSRDDFQGQVVPALKPLLLPAYCDDEGMRRGVMLTVFVLDSDGRQINNFFVRPSDCGGAR